MFRNQKWLQRRALEPDVWSASQSIHGLILIHSCQDTVVVRRVVVEDRIQQFHRATVSDGIRCPVRSAMHGTSVKHSVISLSLLLHGAAMQGDQH